MNVYEDLLRSTKVWADVADQLNESATFVQAAEESIASQVKMFNSVVNSDAMESISRTARLFEVGMAGIQSASGLLEFGRELTERANAFAAYQAAIPELVGSFPKLLDVARIDVPTMESFAPFLNQLQQIHVPEHLLDPSYIGRFRQEVFAQVDALPSPTKETVKKVVRSLEEVEHRATATVDNQDDQVGKTARAMLILALLQTLIAFLGDQRDILETAFEDLATLGAILTPISGYAAIILIILVAARRAQRR